MANSNRRPYLTATTISQALLDACHDNLVIQLEMICDIETPGDTIRASDRNKYAGSVFYEALLKFPSISRTLGEWLSNELQFSTLTLELSNVDGRFSRYLPGGADYDGWIGKSVQVRLGLAEASPSYNLIFKGHVTDAGGFKRSVKSITVIARDDFDTANQKFPIQTFVEATYPKIEDKNIGKIIPVIYGDWTTDTDPSPATIPAFVVNGADPFVHFKPVDVVISLASPGVLTSLRHELDADDPIELSTTGTLPSPLTPGTPYYVRFPTTDTFEIAASPGGSPINTSGPQSGAHKYFPATGEVRLNVKLVTADNDLTFFDYTQVYVKRGDGFQQVPDTEIVSIGAGNKSFELKQTSGVDWFIGEAGTPEGYEWSSSDTVYVRVQGKDLSGYDDNIVEQARDILITYGDRLVGDFDSSWDNFRDKASPTESAIVAFKSRIWIDSEQEAMKYANSLLEQVRLETGVDRNQKFKINSLHFDDFVAAPTYIVRNWDIVRDTFKTSIDDRNIFNRVQGVFNFLPDQKEEGRATAIFRIDPAVTQMGRQISKRIIFPNLFQPDVVANQVKEMLRLAASSPENVDVDLTWRSMLLDLGDFVMLRSSIDGSIFDDVPCMVRSVGFSSDGRVTVKFWSLQMTPFPGYAPGYSGTVGGSGATITEES